MKNSQFLEQIYSYEKQPQLLRKNFINNLILGKTIKTSMERESQFIASKYKFLLRTFMKKSICHVFQNQTKKTAFCNYKMVIFNQETSKAVFL